jgi:CSLREA domain-containing protein
MARLTSILLILFLIIAVIPVTTTRADATIVVNTTADEDNTGPDCSLREAITAANTDADYGGCTGSGAYGTDTITFDGTVFASAQTITLSDRLPDITSSMNIVGPGAKLLTISGNNHSRPFYINVAAAVTISDVTITQGQMDYGAAVDINYGFVTLKSVVLSNNHATQQGGAVILSNGGDPLTQGTLWVIDSTFIGNVTDGPGGAIYSLGTLIVSNSTFTGNSATDGGAIYSEFGSVGLFNVTVSGNAATDLGGGVYAGSGALTLGNTILANSTMQDCTAAATISIQYSLIEDGGCGIVNGQNGNRTGDPMLNTLGNNGGATQTFLPKLGSPVLNAGDNAFLSEANLNLDLNGDGDTADTLSTDQRGTGYPRVLHTTVDMGAVETLLSTEFAIDTISDANLNGCTSLSNDCSLRGAISLANALSGAHTITFDSTVFSTAQTIVLTSALPNLSGNLTIDGGTARRVTISGNHLSNRVLVINSGAVVKLRNLTVSDGGDGGIFNGGSLTLDGLTVSNNSTTYGDGGGVLNTGTMWLLNSTLTGNSAQFGGGMRNSSTAIVVNTTISGNSATNQVGGLRNASIMTLVNSTVSNNSAVYYAGGIEVSPFSTLKMYNTIVANNYLVGQYAGDPQHDMECRNAASVSAYNTLVKDGTCLNNGTGNRTGDPLLGPLANNGGLTQTQLPLPASPVVNTGNNTYLSEATLNLDLNGDGDTVDTIDTDQRGAGYTRINGSAVDMGAVEVHTVPTNTVPPINYHPSSVVTLTWSSLSWATGYEVQVSTSSAFTSLPCGTLQAGNNLSVDTCQLPPGTYYWRVRGKSASQTTATWSTPATFVIAIP